MVVQCWMMLVIVNVLVDCPCGVSVLVEVFRWISLVIVYCLVVCLVFQVFPCGLLYCLCFVLILQVISVVC